MDSVGDVLESLWAVVDGIHGCDVGQQCLGSTDVRCCLLSSDVLLSGLQGHSEGELVVSIDRPSNDSSRHFPHILLPSREKSRVRSSEAHGHSESLSRSEANISTHVSGRLGEGQGQEIRSNYLDNLGLGLVNLVEELGKIVQNTLGVRGLHDDTKELGGVMLVEEFGILANHYV